MKVNKVTQEELFVYDKDELLWEYSFTNSMLTQLFEDNYLTYDPAGKDKLSALEFYELRFIISIFSSDLSLSSVKTLLSALEKPYCYDISKMYYDFISKEWQPLPVFEEPTAVELIEKIIEDEDYESLEYLKEVIENALDI